MNSRGPIGQSVCFMVLLVLVLWPATALASAAGVDLIFLVDQSGSMMGKGRARGIANDPNNKRIDAVRGVETRLVDSALAGFTNRVSVIEFGGRNAQLAQYRPQVTLSQLVIPPSGNASDLRHRIRDALLQVRAVDRGDTDHAAALRLAAAEIQYFRANPPAVMAGGQPGERSEIVILITDGAPYADGVNLSNLRAEIEQQAQRLAQDRVRFTLAVFGFSDDRNTDYWRKGWGTFWEGMASRDPNGAGHAYLLLSDDEAVKKVWAVVSELIPPVSTSGSTATPTASSYVAPAYLQALNLTVDFQTPKLPLSAIDIRDPDNNHVAVSTTGSGGASASITHPQPGMWRLSPKGAQYSVIATPVYETATLAEPLGPVAEGSRLPVRYRLSGRGPGGLLQPQAGLPPVRFELELRSPTGRTVTVPLQVDSPGFVRTQSDVLLNEKGDYALRLTGMTMAIDGTLHTVYASSQAGGDTIAVQPTTPVQLRLEAPHQKTTIRLLQGAAQVPVRWRFYNPQTNLPLGSQEVLKSGVVLEMSWRDDSEDTQNASSVKAPLQATSAGLEGMFPVDFGRTRWDYLLKPGAIKLHLSPDHFWKAPDYHFVGIVDGKYLLSAPLSIQESWLSLWPLAVVLLVLVALWLLWRRFGRAWFTAQRDRRLEQEPKLVFKVIQSGLSTTWSLKGINTLKPGNTRVRLSEDDTWAIEKLKIVRLPSQGKEVAIKLFYRPRIETNKKAKVQQVRLRARDDSGLHNARHRVAGLSDDQEAAFILLIGSQQAS